jgi:hypothetical protein
MANRLGASTAEEVRSAIKQVATNIDGWDGVGYPVKKPRRTWQAMHENATFTIQLTNLTNPINRMLVLVSHIIIITVYSYSNSYIVLLTNHNFSPLLSFQHSILRAMA